MAILIFLLIVLLIYTCVATTRANSALEEVSRLRHEVKLIQAELARMGSRTAPGKAEMPALPERLPPASRPQVEGAGDQTAARNLSALLKAKQAVDEVFRPVSAATPPPLVDATPPTEWVPPPPVMVPPVLPTPAVPAPPLPKAPVMSPAPATSPLIVHQEPAAKPPVRLDWDKPKLTEAAPVNPPRPAAPPKPEFNWEQFMGVKLFAWAGGLVLFIGIVLFVKYAFEHEWISPALRTAMGGATGLALTLVGARMWKSERYQVLAHTLAATGVLILYGVSFAGHMLYDLYNQATAFAMAAAITAGAFVLAVRMEAQAVAVLGILGGFLAPVLLSTGVDHPLALFGYITALDVGILALVHIRDWRHLTALAAGGTGVMVLGWLLKFWEKSGYAFGNATLVPAGMLLFFPALFCAAGWWLARRTHRSVETHSSAMGISWLALLLCFTALNIPSVADRPWLLFGFVFLQYALTGAAAWRETKLMPVCMAAGAGVFLLLAVWAGRALTGGLLPHALALFLIFGVLQTAFPLLWHRAQKEQEALPRASLWMPLPVLVLLLIAVVRVPESATGIWLAVLTVNVLLVTLGKIARQAAPSVAGFVLTVVALLVWMILITGDVALRDSLGTAVMPVIAGFGVVLTAAGLWLRRQWEVNYEESWQESRMLAAVVPVLGSLALLMAATLILPAPIVGSRPWLVFGLVFLQYCLTGLAVMRDVRLMPVSIGAGAALFLLLALWSGQVLTPEMLPHALTLFVIFGIFQTAFPLLWNRAHKGQPSAITHVAWMPLPVLLLLLIGVVRVPESTTGIWIAALVVNAAVLLLGKVSRQAAPAAAGSGITMVLLYTWLMRILNSAELRQSADTFFLSVLSAFAVLLTAGALWLRRQWEEPDESEWSSRVLAPLLPSLLPFPLLIIAASALPDLPFSAIAGIMLGLASLLMLTGVMTRRWLLFPIALGAVICVEVTLEQLGTGPSGMARLAWYGGAWALFLIFPFLRRSVTRGHVLPWITAAISGAVQFLLLHRLVRDTWPQLEPGFIPALCAIPPAVALRLLYADRTTDPAIRLSQLAWFGGVVLLFVTLIIPFQWEKHWLTLGWALEGAALCWLYRRVPHDGLRLTGAVLLVTAFVRLAFNQAILQYYPRTYPIWNWQLYTYGLAIAANIAAVRFLDPPRHLLAGIPLRVIFQAQAGVLIFVLINLEIADYFSPTGSPYIDWPFEGMLARDVTLTIAWGLYSFALVAWGLWKRSRGARYSGVALMGITLLKLFIFDLAGLDSIYRITVTIAVALIALAVSFLYQRFAARLARGGEESEPASRNP